MAAPHQQSKRQRSSSPSAEHALSHSRIEDDEEEDEKISPRRINLQLFEQAHVTGDSMDVLKLETSIANSYVRTRHNNLRCFPRCSPFHMEQRFCGRPLEISTAAISKVALPHVQVIGEMRKTTQRPCFSVGDICSNMILERYGEKIMSAEYLRRHADRDRFVIHPPRKWHYPGKLRSSDRHVIQLYLTLNDRVMTAVTSPTFHVVPVWKADDKASLSSRDRDSAGAAEHDSETNSFEDQSDETLASALVPPLQANMTPPPLSLPQPSPLAVTALAASTHFATPGTMIDFQQFPTAMAAPWTLPTAPPEPIQQAQHMYSFMSSRGSAPLPQMSFNVPSLMQRAQNHPNFHPASTIYPHTVPGEYSSPTAHPFHPAPSGLPLNSSPFGPLMQTSSFASRSLLPFSSNLEQPLPAMSATWIQPPSATSFQNDVHSLPVMTEASTAYRSPTDGMQHGELPWTHTGTQHDNFGLDNGPAPVARTTGNQGMIFAYPPYQQQAHRNIPPRGPGWM